MQKFIRFYETLSVVQEHMESETGEKQFDKVLDKRDKESFNQFEKFAESAIRRGKYEN